MKDYKERCTCPQCPSFVECKGTAFCVDKKSKCIKKEKGCICSACPVHTELKLKNGYYCTRGKQDEK